MRRGLLFLLVATMFAACTEDRIEEVTNQDAAVERIYATIADTEGDDTRVELNEKRQTVWNAGDKIFVYCNSYFREYTFDGKTGDRSGSFTYTTGYGAPDSNAVVNYDKYYAVHLNTLQYSWYSNGDPVFYVTLPATQSYKKNSYGTDTNAMLGTSTDGENFTFKNLYGYLRLSLTGGKVVKSIEISGNANETLAGELKVNKDAQFVQWYQNLSDSITIDCGSGVMLTDIPTNFYVTLPPITFESGISVKVNFTDGTSYPKSTTKKVVISRNTIQPMSTFNTGGEIKWQVVTIEHTGSKISAPTLSGSSAISGYIYWGDGNSADVNSLASYVYEDGQQSHSVTVKSLNATIISFDGCEGITEIDLSNF